MSYLIIIWQGKNICGFFVDRGTYSPEWNSFRFLNIKTLSILFYDINKPGFAFGGNHVIIYTKIKQINMINTCIEKRYYEISQCGWRPNMVLKTNSSKKIIILTIWYFKSLPIAEHPIHLFHALRLDSKKKFMNCLK